MNRYYHSFPGRRLTIYAPTLHDAAIVGVLIQRVTFGRHPSQKGQG